MPDNNSDTRNDVIISVNQGRMARVGLRLTVREFAEMIDVSPNTIARFERGEKMYRRTLRTIREALEKEGAVFMTTDDGLDYVAIRTGSGT